MSDPLALAAARYACEILMMPKRCGYVIAKRMPQPRLLGTVSSMEFAADCRRVTAHSEVILLVGCSSSVGLRRCPEVPMWEVTSSVGCMPIAGGVLGSNPLALARVTRRSAFLSYEIAVVDIFSGDCSQSTSSRIADRTQHLNRFWFFSPKDRSCT
jgi:hypothetical protein